jgi:hypothetical protein
MAPEKCCSIYGRVFLWRDFLADVLFFMGGNDAGSLRKRAQPGFIVQGEMEKSLAVPLGIALTGCWLYFKISVCLYRERCG